MNQLDPEQIRRAALHRDRLRDRDEYSSRFGCAILFASTAIPTRQHTRTEIVDAYVERAENLQKQLYADGTDTHVYAPLSHSSIQLALSDIRVGTLHVIGYGNLDGVLGSDGWHDARSFVARSHLLRSVVQHVSGTFDPAIDHVPFGTFAVASPAHVIAPLGVELDPARLGEDEAGAMQALACSRRLGGLTLSPLLHSDHLPDVTPRQLAGY